MKQISYSDCESIMTETIFRLNGAAQHDTRYSNHYYPLTVTDHVSGPGRRLQGGETAESCNG